MKTLLNPYKRYQDKFRVKDMYPAIADECACGCGETLTGLKTKWSSPECREKSYERYLIILGDVATIRANLYKIDFGACRYCGEITEDWEADHIIPVALGGGACDISNYQTLCKSCHKDKTKYQIESQIVTNSVHAALRFFSLFTPRPPEVQRNLFEGMSTPKQNFLLTNERSSSPINDKRYS